MSEDTANRLQKALEAQMCDDDFNIPSSVQRDKGLVWLEGWFDVGAALREAQS